MGLTCTLFRATPEEIEGVIGNPDRLGAFYDSVEGPGLPVREVRPKGILGWLLRLTPITITEVVPESERGAGPEPRPPDPNRTIDIEKAWHGLHFLFTGTADSDEEPGCYLSAGGTHLDDEGWSRALRPDQTRRFADFLGNLTPEDLRRRYHPERMTKLRIYPEVW
ncbi:MAG TPA: DUF1877 family protein, partial [Methylomirabilota bacterium]|nr:DUF1877 family protein [Methylomirabilota bacterium]